MYPRRGNRRIPIAMLDRHLHHLQCTWEGRLIVSNRRWPCLTDQSRERRYHLQRHPPCMWGMITCHIIIGKTAKMRVIICHSWRMMNGPDHFILQATPFPATPFPVAQAPLHRRRSPSPTCNRCKNRLHREVRRMNCPHLLRAWALGTRINTHQRRNALTTTIVVVVVVRGGRRQAAKRSIWRRGGNAHGRQRSEQRRVDHQVGQHRRPCRQR